uniref:Zinc finger protein 525-like n=1 Tax=Hirondellea gigas TaxID=1518452 RepID=A0A6A7G3S2_9CRUS
MSDIPATVSLNVQAVSSPFDEVYIKEEPIDDAEATTSPEQLSVFKREGSIDIKHESLTTDNANSIRSLAADSSVNDPPSTVFSGSGCKKPNSSGSSGRRILRCSECDYETNRKYSLIVHLRSHTGDKPFPCSNCNYRASDIGKIKRHMRTHTGEKPFKCDECNYKATQKGTLIDHMRIHTGEKPFQCGECNYKATQKSSLNIHMRTHAGEKPFECSECNYKAAHKRSLTTHMRTHAGDSPFQCNF